MLFFSLFYVAERRIVLLLIIWFLRLLFVDVINGIKQILDLLVSKIFYKQLIINILCVNVFYDISFYDIAFYSLFVLNIIFFV